MEGASFQHLGQPPQASPRLLLLEPKDSPSQNTRVNRDGGGQSESHMTGGSGQQSPRSVHMRDDPGSEEGTA